MGDDKFESSKIKTWLYGKHCKVDEKGIFRLRKCIP